MDSTVWRISSDGSSSEKLFSTRMVFWPAIIAAISPDHSKLLYLTRTGTTAADRDVLQLTNIDGSGTIEYASGNILDLPSWSTDGSKFYFYDQLLGAFIGQPGGSPIPVSGFSGVTDVTWVDETRFIGAAGPEGGWRLLLGNADGPAIVIFSTTDNTGFLNYSVNR